MKTCSKMYLRVLCAVFLLSVPLVSCVINSTSTTAVNVTAIDDVQQPQLSTLDKFLKTQRSVVVVDADANSNAFESLPGVQNVTSVNYPQPYPVTQVFKKRLTVTNSAGMNIIVNDLDIDPTSDYISLTPLNVDGSESRPIILTGKLKQPLSIRSLGYTRADLTFEAKTDEVHSYKGFSISYAPYGEPRPPGTYPPDITLSYDQLQTISKLLVVLKKDQTEETWNKLKQLFASSTNSYITSKDLSLEQASLENVTLTRVAECFSSWPDSEDCVEVEFAITLYNDTRKATTGDSYLDDHTRREPAGLSDIQLEEMWEKFGQPAFRDAGIIEYELPDTRTRILMWVGIAIGTCVLVFLILVAVFRSPAFRDRWVEDDTVAIKNKDENNTRVNDDITMYPSPDQVIPEMYPGAGSNGQLPPTEFSLEPGHIRPNNYETINEAYTEDEKPSTRIRGRRTEQSQADASV